MQPVKRRFDKSSLIAAIDNLPDNFTLEDLEYQLNFAEQMQYEVKETSAAYFAKIERGLHQVEAGEVCSHEEAKTRLAKWLK